MGDQIPRPPVAAETVGGDGKLRERAEVESERSHTVVLREKKVSLGQMTLRLESSVSAQRLFDQNDHILHPTQIPTLPGPFSPIASPPPSTVLSFFVAPAVIEP